MGYSRNDRATDIIERAKRKARATGQRLAIVSLERDDCDGYEQRIVPYSYLDSDEYRAFGGQLELLIDRSGNIEL